mgnify:CR=1 FL=1
MQAPPARPGDPVDGIDTPALVVDLDAFERNLDLMANAVHGAGVALRPHGKAHKCPEIALAQLERGAVGICCQKVGEAEAFVAAGVRDVLVTNEIVGGAKLARLAAMAPNPRFYERNPGAPGLARKTGIILGRMSSAELP